MNDSAVGGGVRCSAQELPTSVVDIMRHEHDWRPGQHLGGRENAQVRILIKHAAGDLTCPWVDIVSTRLVAQRTVPSKPVCPIATSMSAGNGVVAFGFTMKSYSSTKW